jgi:FkbM family methyltransferase
MIASPVLDRLAYGWRAVRSDPYAGTTRVRFEGFGGARHLSPDRRAPLGTNAGDESAARLGGCQRNRHWWQGNTARMKRFFRRSIRRWLERRGYHLKYAHVPLRKAPAFFTAMRPKGLAPATVIDVGVGYGTPWLMRGFPDAYTVLVEPNDGFRPAIDRLMANRRGEVHFMAAGPEAGEAVLHLNVVTPTSSTMSEVSAAQRAEQERHGWRRETREVTVPVGRLDSLPHGEWPKPFLMKIDAEGFELEVLKGATGLLPDVECLIAEVSVAERYAGGYSFAEFIAALDGYGFQLLDITDMLQFGPDGRLSTIDAVFVPKGSPLLTA